MFGNPKYNYKTSISANSSEESARDYFVGTTFNVGAGLSENMQECVDIQFTGNTSEGSDKCECIDPTFTLSKGETLRTCTRCHKLIEQ
jgi:hypothetical protein